MLELLFPSKQRRKIWLVLFSHPEKSFYLRELARLAKLNPTQVSREIKQLEKDGVIEVSRDGNRKYFKVREDFLLLPEFKSIVKKTLGTEAVLRKWVKNFEGIKLAFIYGSVARNEEREGSDIDLLLVGRIKPVEFDRKLRKVENALGRELNYTIFSEREFKIKRLKEPFLKDILREKKIILIDKINALKSTN